MPTYEVELDSRADRQLDRFHHDRKLLERIGEAIDGLEETPRPNGAEKLSGGHALYRIRVGSVRIVYSIDDASMKVLITKIDSRDNVYRQRRR